MESENKVLVYFGNPVKSQGVPKSEIKVDLKIKNHLNAKFLKDQFKIQLKAKAKPGCGAEALEIFKKLLNPEKRFQPIPQLVYYSIQQGYIQTNFSQQEDTVIVEVTPGPQFAAVSQSLQSSFKSFGFEDVAKDGFSLNLSLASSQSFVEKAVNFATVEDDFISPHVLADSRMALTFDRDPAHVSVIDSFMSVIVDDRRLVNFSAVDHIDAEIEVDLANVHLTKKTIKKNYLLSTIENLFKDAVAMFNTYSEKQLKQITKLKSLLKEKVQPDFEVKATLKEIGELGIQIKGEGLFEFFEFICLHPTTSDSKDHISAFYELWLSKIAPQ